MEQFTVKNLLVRVSDQINYSWLLLEEQVDREAFIDSLSDEEFHLILQRYNLKNIVVDCSKMWSFGIPEMSDFLDTEFAQLMSKIGVEKISVILNEEVITMLSFIFQGIESKHSESLPIIRFFPISQFYESFESVNWFD